MMSFKQQTQTVILFQLFNKLFRIYIALTIKRAIPDK